MTGGYEPALPPAEVARIARWHEAAYRAAVAEAGGRSRTMSHLGRTFLVPPEVQPVTGMSALLGEAVLAEVRDTDRVLDLGTGCGLNAVLAASRSTDVLAVDVNPVAVEAARHNAAANGVGDRVEVRLSDVFSAVDGLFDLVVADPPFRWFRPRDLLEAATTDEGYRALTAFVRGVGEHLAPGGRVLLFFGTSGALGHLYGLLDEAGLHREVLARRSLDRDGTTVEYLVHRLTRRAGDQIS